MPFGLQLGSVGRFGLDLSSSAPGWIFLRILFFVPHGVENKANHNTTWPCNGTRFMLKHVAADVVLYHKASVTA